MSKRKTQIDRAVEQLEAKKAERTRKYDAELVAVRSMYEAEIAGIDASIETLRGQPVRKARKPKPAPPADGR